MGDGHLFAACNFQTGERSVEGREKGFVQRFCLGGKAAQGEMARAKLAGVDKARVGCLRRSRKLARGRGHAIPEQDLDLGLIMQATAPPCV